MPHENNKPAKSCFRDATAAHDAETVRLGAGPLTPAKANTVMAQMHDRIRTLEDELKQAKADRDVLAKEVNARRLELEWRAHEGDLDRDDVWRWMEEAEAATDASGALSRAGGK